MKKAKVLVLGASGMVGHVLVMRLKEFPDEFEVFTASRKQANGQSDFILDAANFDKLRKPSFNKSASLRSCFDFRFCYKARNFDQNIEK